MSRHFYWTLAVIGAIALMLFGAVQFLRQIHPDDGSYIPRPVDPTPEIEMLRNYVRIDTSTPEGEVAGAKYLIRLLQQAGISSELIESAPGHANVYARIRGSSQSGGLMLLHHIDVVPADPKDWSAPPFEGRITSGLMWGRGTIDMKGIGICELAAFVAIARSGKRPLHDVVFLAVADEEHGGRLGMEWIAEHRPDVLEGIDFAINEGGITEMKGDELTYFGVEIGTKAWMKARVVSDSKEKLEEARIALEPYYSPREPNEILPAVREYFASIAPYRIEARSLLGDIDRTVARGEFWKLDSSYRDLTQNNVGSSGIARSPDGRWSMRVYLDLLPGVDGKAYLKNLHRKFFPDAEVTLLGDSGPIGFSSWTTPFSAVLKAEIARQYPGAPAGPVILSRSSTDSRFLRARGIEAYGLMPYRVNFFQSHGVHAVDENIRLDWFTEGVELTRNVVKRWCDVQ
ncbi:MAG: M20/M25/M40 family metallo-hydrolase [Thermoanaerobaculia bacterium]